MHSDTDHTRDAEFDSEDDSEVDVTEYDAEFDPADDPESCESKGVPADPTSEPSACAYTDYSASGRDPEDLPATGEGATGVEKRVWDALYDVDDPEMPVSIVDLGLIYGVTVDDDHAAVEMTLTYTGCPARKMLTEEVQEAAAAVEGVESADLRLVWSPEWSIEMVTEQGKDDLREFGLSV